MLRGVPGADDYILREKNRGERDTAELEAEVRAAGAARGHPAKAAGDHLLGVQAGQVQVPDRDERCRAGARYVRNFF